MHDLNGEQHKALTCDLNHHCLVTAGPGSGKTRFLVERMKGYVRHSTEGAVLCFAFTNEAANEIHARASVFLPQDSRANVSTIHRFCTGILRSFWRIMRPGSPSLRVMKDSEQFAAFVLENVPSHLLKEAWNDLRKHSENQDELETLSSDGDPAESCSDTNMHPEPWKDDLSRMAKSIARTLRGLQCGSNSIDSVQFSKALVQVYDIYESAMQSANIIDIRCIVSSFIREFHKLAPLLADLRYLLVDEFQDLDHQQLDLVRLLINHGMVMTAVGDFNQSIYSWRSRAAKPAIGQRPAKTLKRDTLHLVSNPTSYEVIKTCTTNSPFIEYRFLTNHRNDYEIARASNLLVGLPAVTGEDVVATNLGFARVVICRSAEDETNRLIQILRCMQLNNTLRDCAVLVRYNVDKERLRTILKESDIPTVEKKQTSNITSQGTRNSASKSLLTILCILRTITRNHDAQAFVVSLKLACMTAHNKDIENDIIKALSTIPEWTDHCRKWWESSDNYDPLSTDDNSSTSRSIIEDIENVKYDMRTLSGIRIKSLVSKFVANIAKCSLSQSLESLIANIKTTFKLKTTRDVAKLEELVRGRTIPVTDSLRFLRAPDMWASDKDQPVSPKDGVHVSTIHSAKGREWSTVIIPFVNEGTIPSIVGEIGEERRVLYVAMTRAKNNLILSCHQSGRTIPSRFISDCQIRPCERFDDILSRFA